MVPGKLSEDQEDRGSAGVAVRVLCRVVRGTSLLFSSLGSILRRGIAGSYGNSILFEEQFKHGKLS